MEANIAAFFISPQFFIGFGMFVVAVLAAGIKESYDGWKQSRGR